VLRGLHYQFKPIAQGKLVRCVQAKFLMLQLIFEISIPLECGWINLSAENKRNYGYQKALHMVFWFERAEFYTRPQIITAENERTYYGMMNLNINWPSNHQSI
jgi:dTDP-4-dehydrorhamnose 3,5-epimerase